MDCFEIQPNQILDIPVLAKLLAYFWTVIGQTETKIR